MREVLAGLVGDPGRADWKVCTQSEEQVAAAAEAFKAAFGPYDPSGRLSDLHKCGGVWSTC